MDEGVQQAQEPRQGVGMFLHSYHYFQLSIFNFPLDLFYHFPLGLVKALWALHKKCGENVQLCTKLLDICFRRQYNKRWISIGCSALGNDASAFPFGVARRALLFRSGPAPGTNPILKDSGGVFEGIWNGIFGRSSSSLLLLSSF